MTSPPNQDGAAVKHELLSAAQREVAGAAAGFQKCVAVSRTAHSEVADRDLPGDGSAQIGIIDVAGYIAAGGYPQRDESDYDTSNDDGDRRGAPHAPTTRSRSATRRSCPRATPCNAGVASSARQYPMHEHGTSTAAIRSVATTTACWRGARRSMCK